MFLLGECRDMLFPVKNPADLTMLRQTASLLHSMQTSIAMYVACKMPFNGHIHHVLILCALRRTCPVYGLKSLLTMNSAIITAFASPSSFFFTSFSSFLHAFRLSVGAKQTGRSKSHEMKKKVSKARVVVIIAKLMQNKDSIQPIKMYYSRFFKTFWAVCWSFLVYSYRILWRFDIYPCC